MTSTVSVKVWAAQCMTTSAVNISKKTLTRTSIQMLHAKRYICSTPVAFILNVFGGYHVNGRMISQLEAFVEYNFF